MGLPSFLALAVFRDRFACAQLPGFWLIFDGIKQAIYFTEKVAELCMLGFSAGRGDPSSFAQLDLPA